jgi:hypothetical protein
VYTPDVPLSSGQTAALFVLLALLLAAVSLGQRRPLPGPSVALLRSLLPSWRLFEAPEGQVLLLARSAGSAEEAFVPAIPAPARGLTSLLFAPRGNLLLACHDLVDSLVSDLAELGPTQLEQAEQLVSYRLVQNMVQWQLRARHPHLAAYQLKLVSRSQDGLLEELFVSPVYAC